MTHTKATLSNPAQIYANGTHVGGSDDLAAKLQDGTFASLLKNAAAAAALPSALQQAVERAAASAAASSSSGGGKGGPALSPELQALAGKLADPKAGVAVRSTKEKNFSGNQLLLWLEQNASGSGGKLSEEEAAALEEEAAALGARLLAANVVTRVGSQQPSVRETKAVAAGGTYRLKSDAPRAVAWGQPLNTAYCEFDL